LKIFLQIIAWLGALIIGLSVPLAYSSGGFNVDMYEMGLLFSAFTCAIGVFLLLLGGLISRGRFLWMVTLFVGIAYIAVLPRVWMPHETIVRSVGWMDWMGCLMSAFPGLVCIIGGILMRWLTLRSNKKVAQIRSSDLNVL
jgi:hypothetical protein